MRDKARHGTQQVRRTLRNRPLRIGIGLAVLFAFGLMASGAFGDNLLSHHNKHRQHRRQQRLHDRHPQCALVRHDRHDRTPPQAPPTRQQARPPPESVPYIVTFKSGVADAQQQDDIAAANGTAGDAISVLHMYSLSFPVGEDSSDAQTLAANPDVASVTADLSRDTADCAERPPLLGPVVSALAADRVGPTSSARSPRLERDGRRPRHRCRCFVPGPAERRRPGQRTSSTATGDGTTDPTDTAPRWPGSSRPRPTTTKASPASATAASTSCRSRCSAPTAPASTPT